VVLACFKYLSFVLICVSLTIIIPKGSTYGIVPYVDATVNGSVAGIVGSGGNIGGVVFAYLFLHQSSYRAAFMSMGCIVVASAVWTIFISIPGHRGLLTGQDSAEIVEHRRHAKLPAVILVNHPSDSSSVSDGSVMICDDIENAG
jgi:NNP family nitrate/nitrite transporter-like MFS transporter